MQHLLTIIIFIIFSFVLSASLIAFLLFFRYKTKFLWIIFLFQIIQMLYILTTDLNVYFFNIIQNQDFAVDWVFSNFYFFWFAAFLYIVPTFFGQLTDTKLWKIIKFLPVIPVIMMVLPYIFEHNSSDINSFIRFEIDLICYIIFYLIYIGFIIFSGMKMKQITDYNKKWILVRFFYLSVIFIPFFLLDGFHPILYQKLKIIPYGFKFSFLYITIWSGFFIQFAVKNLLLPVPAQSWTLHDNIIQKYSLTLKEKEIVQLLIDGLSNRQIADKLFLAPQTVKNYIYNLFQKTGVGSRRELEEKIKKEA